MLYTQYFLSKYIEIFLLGTLILTLTIFQSMNYKSDKLCIIYNFAPHYREAIFKKIDSVYNCDWYFGESQNGIKELTYSLLKSVRRFKSIGKPGKFIWQLGILPLLFKKEYQTFFMLADSHTLSNWLFFFLAPILTPRKKVYIWTHGWYGKESDKEAKLKLWLYRRVSGVFLYGNYAKNLLIKKGIDENKLYVLHNSLDYDKQLSLRNNLQPSIIFSEHFNNNNPTLIFIGRLTPVKRLDLLIEAIAILKKRGVECNVVLVGDGKQKDFLQDLVQEHNLGQNFWFYGACYDNVKNAELIYNADLCVSPGNVGLTAMHSLVFGTPVITHNDFKWQMPEFESIIPGVTGDFFYRDDVDSLVMVINKWIWDKRNLRQEVRNDCFKEIDSSWTPDFQINVIQEHIKIGN